MRILRLASLSLIAMMAIPFVADAHCPRHAHCDKPGSDPVPNYNLTFGVRDGDGKESDLTIANPEDVDGLWSESQSGGRFIGLQQTHDVVTTIDLTFFADLDLPKSDSVDCFVTNVSGGPKTVRLNAGSLERKNIKGGLKQAIGSFWFVAKNRDDQDVNYILQTFGTLLVPDNWPGENTLTMGYYEMKTASGNGEASNTACISEGPIFVKMILKTPPPS